MRDRDGGAVEASASRCSSSERPTASRCASGSSSSSTSGSWARQAASAISLRCPPESALVGRSRSASSIPRSSSIARARPSMLGPPAASQRSTSSSWRREHAGHPVEVGGELGRGELLGDAVQVAVELVEVGAGRADRLERVPLVAERVLREEGDDDARAAAPTCRRRAPRARRSASASSTCPTPFAPTTPTRAPGSIAKSSPSSTVRLPNDLRTAFSETRAIGPSWTSE